MTTEKIDVCQIVTDKIILQLEQGVVPWRKAWKSGNGGNPANYASRKAYRGINWLLLSLSQYSAPFWLTYRQAAELGGTVKKGERGTQVVFWSFVKSKTEKKANGEAKVFAFAKYYIVFNVEQCENVGYVAETVDATNVIPVNDAAEGLLAAWKSGPQITFGGNRACYSPALDCVAMPQKEAFDTADNFYSVLFHELTHATGHTSRLNRLTEQAAFGSSTYAKEELVAELGAAFLGANVGLVNTLEQSASYIAGWLKALKDDRRLVLSAAGKAQAAADLILGNSVAAE